MCKKRIKNIKGKIIRYIWKLFETEEEKEERKGWEKQNKNESLIKDKIIRDIMKLFEEQGEDYYYKPKTIISFWNNNYI